MMERKRMKELEEDGKEKKVKVKTEPGKTK